MSDEIKFPTMHGDIEATEGTEKMGAGSDGKHSEEEVASEPFNDTQSIKSDADHLRAGLEMEEYQAEHRKYWKTKAAFCAVGLIIGFVFCFVELGNDRKINQCLAIAIWMATLWLTEAIPLVVTAFLPIVLFPLFGIVSSADITSQYANNTIFLFISGFLMALTLQRWNLHRRFSLKLLTWCGVRPQLLLLGIMGGTFFLSMFVSNTATSLMMVPNALSICRSLEESTTGRGTRDSRRFATAILLGIAYSANVGGMASLLGTPPNLVLQRQLAVIFPDAPEMTFAIWLGFGIPIALIMLFFVWGYLSFMYLRKLDMGTVNPDIFKNQYQALGPWSYEQIVVTLLFALEALLWIFRKDLEFENVTIQGWANIFPDPSAIHDATVGMGIAILLFLCPGRGDNMAVDAPGYEPDGAEIPKRTSLLDWRTANTMPYDIVFLFGGGFALAKAFVESGLSAYLGEELKGLDSVSTAGVVFVVSTLIIWLTELTSNTATSNIMIPIAASLAIALETNPYTFMIPVAISCSCAFALPIATPPNMVVFSTGLLPLREMNKAGLFLNVISSVVILMGAFTFIPWVLGEDPSSFPDWAETSAL